ncbi:MAG: ATP-binding protein [Gammaproteobacteria bacterium]|nr:ATP-binding protein [Gammaproteobacteria bacterium]
MNEQANWMANNDRHLAATVAWIHLRLERLAAHTDDKKNPSTPDNATIEQAHQKKVKRENSELPPALTLLGNALGLSEFDRHVLALCVAMELNTQTASLCANAQDNLDKPYPTFALAFALFDDPDWGALSPHSPLRYWRLLEINQPGAQPLTGAALVADERIVNYLKGLNYLDDRLTPLIDPIRSDSTGNQQTNQSLPPSQQQKLDTIISCLQYSGNTEGAPIIELVGHDSASKRLIATRIATASGVNLQTMSLKNLPGQIGDFETFTRLWQRECLLMPLALYIDINGATDSEKALLKRFLERSRDVVFLDVEDSNIDITRQRLSVEINKPTPEEQQQLWAKALQDKAKDQPQRLAEQFSFSQNEINRLARTALDQSSGNEPSSKQPENTDLWQACRIAARAGMEQLARRIDAKATWKQLVLPPEQKALLHQITDQVAQRNRVYEEWGFREQMNRGLGINALFAGESGTGKTMAAEVIANALELDLYRIDLSSVVSKYIGETEKNLRKLFDAAEDSGAILFFDEADALFGKRSEVKDSHDRYANIEINYLLQRMESYQGLAILASNMKSSLDKAFVRRLRFIVDFPFPGIKERTEIWQKVFPPKTPVDENFDCNRLAKLNLTGGNIHNVALSAAFMAAKEKISITMPLLLNAARIEYKKLEKPAKESDFIWQGNLEVVT